MATTIQEIELPKLARARDTSGNNNHGQIYSGRGLEFDGVGDYIHTPLDGNPGVFGDQSDFETTIAFWYNPSDADGLGAVMSWARAGQITDGSPFILIKQNNNGTLRYFLDGDYRDIDFAFQDATWYRIVLSRTASDNTWRFYLNGVEAGSHDDSGTPNNQSSADSIYFGIGYNRYFSGMLSDSQVWNKAFTQADVTFDYLNPEQTAISGGGTALTESNLKLWYPMQDGHRGQQSYILDGANTGLGVEEVTNGGLTTDLSGWSSNGVNATNTIAWETGGARIISTTANISLSQSNVLTIGKNYKITCDVNITYGNIGLDGVTVADGITRNLVEGFNEITFTAASTTLKIKRVTGNSNCLIDNISVKAINDKHHATTVFHGDELVTNGDFATSDLSDFTVTYATHAIVSEELKVTLNTTNGYGFSKATFPAVVGRSYRVLVGCKQGTGDTTNIKEESGITITQETNAGDWSYNEIGVATSTTCVIRLQAYGADTEYALFDNVSIQEVGTASGWTDADQQLHIPQTALQSYNELAWFDGLADYVAIADHNDFSFGNATTDSAMSISAWIYMNDATTFPVICKDSADQREWQLRTTGGDTLTFMLWDDSTDAYQGRSYNTAITSREGEWLHVVATYSGNQADADAGINLYINGVLVDNVDNSSGSYTAMENKTAGIRIGSNERATSYANGAITETSIWADELSQAEVNELYNDGKALDALTHSAAANIKGYWRNNGLSTWVNLNDPGTHDGTPTSVTETLLIPQGIDSSRDSQGFIMNKQRNTSSLNQTNGSDNPHVDLGSITTVADDAAASFVVWLKPDDVIANYFIGSTAADYLKIHTATSLAMKADNSTAAVFTVGTIVPKDWIHVAFTRKASNDLISVYINGVLNGTASTDTETLNEPFDYRYLSALNDGESFRGSVDGFLIYESELSAAEVLRNYNATKGSHTN